MVDALQTSMTIRRHQPKHFSEALVENNGVRKHVKRNPTRSFHALDTNFTVPEYDLIDSGIKFHVLNDISTLRLQMMT